MKSRYFFIITWIFLLAGSAPAYGASAAAEVKKALQESPSNVGELAYYPDAIREAMLEAALFPEAVSKLGALQNQTHKQFRKLISPLSRNTQKQVYELTRYPDLVRQLAAEKKLSKDEIKELSESYPEDIRKIALDLGRKQHGLLRNIQGLYESSDRQFAATIQDLPLTTQQAFRRLLEVPEALNLMYEDMALTRQLGQAYREDKPGSLRALEEWSKQARTEQTDAAEAWEKDVRSDPKAMKEMEAAGKVYAQEMGYDLDDDPPQSEDRTYVYLNFAPYPYWFGYPYWFAYPYWRPYPYWYNTGFYWGVGGIYFWGYPSYYYNYWYYNWPGYYYRYPYYSYYYGSYYYGRYQPGFNYRGGPYYPGYGRVVYPKTYPWHRGNPAWQNSRGQPTMGANPRRPAPVGSGQRQPTAISPRQEFRGGAPGTKPVPHIERVRSPERVRTSDVAPVRSTDRSFQPASRSNRPVMETSNFRSTTPTRAPSSGFQPRGGGGSFRSFGGMGPSRSGGSFGGGGRHR